MSSVLIILHFLSFTNILWVKLKMSKITTFLGMDPQTNLKGRNFLVSLCTGIMNCEKSNVLKYSLHLWRIKKFIDLIHGF